MSRRHVQPARLREALRGGSHELPPAHAAVEAAAEERVTRPRGSLAVPAP